MTLGRVVGTVVATRKEDRLSGFKLQVVETLDPDTVLLEGVPSPGFLPRDVSRPVDNPEDHCDCRRGGRDGYEDKIFRFPWDDVLAAVGPVADGEEVELTLTGNLIDGTPIVGIDCVIVLGGGP